MSGCCGQTGSSAIPQCTFLIRRIFQSGVNCNPRECVSLLWRDRESVWWCAIWWMAGQPFHSAHCQSAIVLETVSGCCCKTGNLCGDVLFVEFQLSHSRMFNSIRNNIESPRLSQVLVARLAICVIVGCCGKTGSLAIPQWIFQSDPTWKRKE